MVNRYKNQLLKNTFIKRVIAPQVTISEEALEDYYLNHQEKFTKPDRFKIQQITVKTWIRHRIFLITYRKEPIFPG